jgi:hypothetical protein
MYHKMFAPLLFPKAYTYDPPPTFSIVVEYKDYSIIGLLLLLVGMKGYHRVR